MKIDLSEYEDCILNGAPEVKEVFDASFNEAARVMGPQGQHNYLEGARAFCELGRGPYLVAAWLESMPAVCKEVGDGVIPDVVTSAMKLTSMVSGEVIRLMLGTLPTAARRLGDSELLIKYLALIHQLSAKVPRGLRPMLERLDELLGKLTLGGLRRWALWGAQAYARDFAKQTAYFSLESPDSQKMLQQERRGTLFVDTQRKLNFYLRALWGRDFFLRPTSGDYESREGMRPFLEQGVVHVPDAYDDVNGIPGLELYRAACAHAAAHLSYTLAPISAEALNPVQMFLIGMIEDARVEHLAIAEFPGLRKLWRQFHDLPREGDVDPAVAVLERLAGALLAGQAQPGDDPLIGETVEEFNTRISQDATNSQLSWDIGVTLYNRLNEHLSVPSLRLLEQTLNIPYRDDNRIIWEFAENVWDETAEYVPASQRQVRKTVSAIEMANEVDCELAGDDAQEIWRLETELFPYEDNGVSYNEMEGKEPVSEPYHYNEWDYQVQLYRPDWVTVLEKRQSKGDPEDIDQILVEHKPIASRLRHIIDALIPQGIIRKRHQEDGDEIDINAAIRAMIDLRMGEMPDQRINIRYERKLRDLAVLVLLDLSESTNEVLGDSDRPVIQLAREATALLSWAVDGIGDPFAIHGFASDSRHDVQYYRFKDFDAPYDDEVRARLAGMKGGYSTRMGAAFRHAAHYLSHQPQQKKLLLLVSDGEPADIDVKDPQYLRHDTKKAVDELGREGIRTYCLTLDPHADDYVSRIFGPNGYTVVDHVQRLPERLPSLFASLTS
ncbi:MAG: VWA domain-containing protein [Gammaproteobacteria bacterium]|jgi:nitric oxide reductase NorD protein